MKKKKGFTLFEILAVLTLVLIISGISVYMIMNVTSKSKIEIYKDSCYELIEAANMYVSNKDEIFVCDGKKCINEDGIELSLKGGIPLGGRIIIEDGKVSLNYIKYLDFCAYGNRENLFVSKNCKDLDITDVSINIDNKLIEVTESKITLNLLEKFVVDYESGIKNITVNLYQDKYLIEQVKRDINKNELSNEEYIFENLDSNTTYYIEIIIENGAEGVTILEKFEIITE